MKILICQEKYSEKFIALTNCLNSLRDISVATMNKGIDNEALISYKPDVVIHNSPFLVDRLNGLKLLQIYIHENVPMSCRQIDLSTLGPIVDRELLKNVRLEQKYVCDVSYIGDPTRHLVDILKYNDLCLRVFNDKPITIPEYCGHLNRFSFPSVYKSSLISLYSVYEDMGKLYEILLSGGNPVVVDDMNSQKFHNDMKLALAGQKVVNIETSQLESSLSHKKLAKCLHDLDFKVLAKKLTQ